MNRSFSDHFKEYREKGYTIFSNFMDKMQIDDIRLTVKEDFEKHFIENPKKPRITIDNLLSNEKYVHLFLPNIKNKKLLDFAENVMGPYLQLDSYEITGFPSDIKNECNKVAGWHRDAFNYSGAWGQSKKSNHREDQFYLPPLACNCITYLQNMNEDTGQLRIINGSHVDYTYIKSENLMKPHKKETLITLNEGDMVFTHNEILHSGSVNSSERTRYFISIYFQRFGFPHRDTFKHPLIDKIKNKARIKNDKRILRLLGEDPKFEERERYFWEKMKHF